MSRLAFFAASAALATSSLAASITMPPSADAAIYRSGGKDYLDPPGLALQMIRYSDSDLFGLMLFPLQSLPANATITSASLSVFGDGLSNPAPMGELTEYNAGSTLTASDAKIVGTSVSNFTPALESYTISVPTIGVQAALSGGYLGLRFYNSGSVGTLYDIATLENVPVENFPVPKLTITYTPEPGSLTLLSVAGVALRRRRSA